MSLSSSSAIQNALQNLTDTLNENVATGFGSHGPTTLNTTSFSVALFSTSKGNSSEQPFFYEYHHTASALKNSSSGVQSVDASSIYRIGTLTQVFTVWVSLIEVEDSLWYTPVTKYVPELAEAARTLNAEQNPIDYVDWDNVFIGDLASHMAGIGRDYGATDLSTQNLPFSSYGFPPLNSTEKVLCDLHRLCSRAEFFSTFTHRAPVYLPSTTPIFSNAAFQILSYVVENITNKTFESILNNDIFQSLGMTQSSLLTPLDSSTGVIPTEKVTSGWSTVLGDESPASSIFSTITDLSRAGKAILSSTLLSPAQTRRWLKPVTHTSNLVNSNGRPWEIYSQVNKDTDPIIDVYTKLGSIGHYSSYLGLLPDYDVGFVILAVDQVVSPDLNAYADIVGDSLVPGIIGTAVGEALLAYGGTYHDALTSSTMTISVSLTNVNPGLSVDAFTTNNNGTDIRAAIALLNNISDPAALSFRLYPTNLKTTTTNTTTMTTKVAFRAVFQDESAFEDGGTPTCISWMGVDGLTYEGVALDLVVFELDMEGGRAIGVKVPAFGLELRRKGE